MRMAPANPTPRPERDASRIDIAANGDADGRYVPTGESGPFAVAGAFDGKYITAEVSRSAVRWNLALLKDMARPARLCATVKGDAYGHGLRGLVDVLAEGADMLAVTAPVEAYSIRRLGYDGPLLMLFTACGFAGPERRAALRDLVDLGAVSTVTCRKEVPELAAAARAAGRRAEVHVMIDSGMCRGGVPAGQAPELVAAVRGEPDLELTGLYTHFATADEADKAFARRQLTKFLAAVEAAGGREGLLLHAANSPATIDLPQARLDMIRPGLSVFGYQPSDVMHNRPPLRPALRVTAPLMQVRDVPAGSRCGYGLTHGFDRPARLGLVPIGYADGYQRVLSNRATMRVRGVDCPVRGRVSMDQTLIELTDVPAAAIGDEAEVVAPVPGAPHCVESLSALADTVPQEILCGFRSPRIRRVFVD